TETARLNRLRDASANELVDVRSMLTTRTAELARVHDEVHSRERRLHDLAFEVTRRSREVQRRSAEMDRLQLTLHTVCGSASWRITRPLRAVRNGGDTLRRILHRFVSEIGKEEKSLPPDIPRVLRLMRVTRTVVRRSGRNALRSL